MQRSRHALVAGLVIAGWATAFTASPVPASTFSASAGGLGAGGSTPQQVLDAPYGGPGGAWVASAVADRGILRAKAFVQSVAGCGCTPNISGGASDIVSATDVVITGPAGPATVPGTIHLVLEGSLAATGPNPWSSIKVSTYVTGPDNVSHSGAAYLSGGSVVSSGILAGQSSPTFNRNLDVDLGALPVGTPFTIVFDLAVQADGTAFYLTYNTGTADFFTAAGLHFPGSAAIVLASSVETLGPVFTLPLGYTSNIPSLNVVDNLWTGGTTPARATTWGRLKRIFR